MKKFIVKTEGKLSRILLDYYSGGLSFSRLNKLFREKDVKVNGARVKNDVRVFSGDEIEVYYDGEMKKTEYVRIFEDENVLIILKPKKITSEAFYESVKTETGNLYFCHRLDRNTDGVMIFAKNERSYEEILGAFRKKTFEKYYEAEVYGSFGADSGRLVNYLEKDSQKGYVRVYDEKREGTLFAELEYKVIEKKDCSTVLEIKLNTGRTHQVRAQMAHIGHFVLGDGKYGDDRINRRMNKDNLCLKSKKLVVHFEKNGALGYLDGKTFVAP